jgi:hypothetical protein
MIVLKIQKNFRKFIHQELTKSKKMGFTHTIVGDNLLINPFDQEEVGKVMKRLELRLK